MKKVPTRNPSKKLARIIAAIVAGSLTISGMAWSATTSTSPFPNVPLGTNLSVAPNLIFLQDDSGSMQWDWIGDGGTYLQDLGNSYNNPYNSHFLGYAFPVGTPNVFNVNFSSGYSNTYGDNIPSFSSQDVLAGQYRSTQINPIYYNPAITYLPWACAVSASKENPNTSPTPTITNGDGQTVTCQWNSQVNLWLMPDANPQKVYLNPWFPKRGWRDFETWNDSTNPASTTTTNGGFSGANGNNSYYGTTWWYVSPNGQIESYSGKYINNLYEINAAKNNCKEHNCSIKNVCQETWWGSRYCQNEQVCDSSYTTCVNSIIPAKQYGFWPAVYFNYTGNTSGTSKDTDEDSIANYQKVEICPSPTPDIPLQISLSGDGNTNVSSTIAACSYPTQPTNTSAYPYTTYSNGNYIYVTGPNQKITRTYTQEIQNYANWYQYARNHIFLARDGISQAFMSLPSGFRVDYATINQITNNGNNYSGVPFYDNGNSGGAADSQALGASQASAPSGDTVGTLEHFDGPQRQWFLSTFFGYQTPEQGTPSRQALTAIGNWLMQPNNISAAPWGASAGATGSRDSVLTCRQNFTVFVTDGGWNNDSAVSSPSGTINTPDQVTGPTISGSNGQSYTYTPTPPFMDQPGNNTPTASGGTACDGSGSCYGSLANIAFWYWEHPLQKFGSSTAPIYDVPTSPSDPAFWPHMDTFTVGLGVNGYLSYPGDLTQLQTGKLAWPKPFPSNSGNNPALIDDLWHAGINGHGNYYSASNPTELSSGLTSALQTIEARTLSNSSVAVTGAQLSTSSLAFVPSYNTGNWTGDVKSFLYNPGTNTFNTNYNWSAQSNISAQQKNAEQDTRTNNSSAPVYTLNGNGVVFSASTLSSTQQTALLNPAFVTGTTKINQVVDNILGNTSEDGILFRNRGGKVLGDIIDATPQYVGAPDLNYTFPGYGTFANNNASRIPVLYTPANDGMLHAIDACATSYPSGVTAPAGCSGAGGADAGKELWAYIPNAVIPYLDQRISLSAFSHQYLMDSTPTTGDFCTGGSGTGNTGTCSSGWESLLVASEGRGVSGIYALNITNPQPSAATALDPWEITPNTTDFSDMGYIIASPLLVKTQSMGWVVIFGSGYQPTPTSTGDGYIYFVNPNNGDLLYAVTLPNQVTGSQLSVAGIAAASFNSPGYAQALYVTDNEGDLWKIDLPADTTPTEGTAAGSTPPTIGYGGHPMFVAEDSTSARQPISTAPIASMDAQGRVGVIFGTGQWLFSSDSSDNQTQSLYGVWDVNQNNTTKRTTPIPESDLVQQTLTTTTATASAGGTAYNTRSGSSNPVPYSSGTGGKKGWYINLPISGERLIDNPQIVFGDAIFTSFVPGATGTNPCQSSGSGTSWITAVNFNTGAVPSTNPFGFTGSALSANSIQVAGQAPQPTVTSTATGMKLLLPGVNGGSPNAVPFFPPFNAGAATRAWTNK